MIIREKTNPENKKEVTLELADYFLMAGKTDLYYHAYPKVFWEIQPPDTWEDITAQIAILNGQLSWKGRPITKEIIDRGDVNIVTGGPSITVLRRLRS